MKTRRLLFFIIVPLFLLSLGWGIRGYLRFWAAVDTIAGTAPDKILPSLKREHIDIRKVLEAGTKHADRNARIKSAWALGELGDSRAVPSLVAALSDRAPHVQESALKALKTLGKKAIPDLLRTIERQSVVFNHDRIAELFESIADTSLTSSLVGILRRGGPFARECAVRVLAVVGGRGAVDPLINAVANDAPDVARCAAEALGAIGDRRAVPALVNALRFQDVRMRLASAQSLGRLGDTAAAVALLGLLEGDTSSAIAEVCIAAFDSLGDYRAVKILLDLAQNPRYARMRVQIVSALRSCASGAVDIFDAILSEGPTPIRLVVAEALAGIPDTSFVEMVISAAQDEDSQVRRTALEGLARLIDARAVDVFRGLLQDPDMDIRRHAVRSLGRNRDRASVGRIAGILSDSRIDGITGIALRQDAAAALGGIGDPAAGPVLIRVVRDRSNPPALRSACADALGLLKHAPAVKVLMECLSELPGKQIMRDVVQWDIRLPAARALGEIGDPRALDALLSLVDAEDRKLRIGAISALGGLDHAKAVGRLNSLLGSPDPETSATAQAALAKRLPQ